MDSKKLTPQIIERVRALATELSPIVYSAAVAMRNEADNLERVLEVEAKAEVTKIVGGASYVAVLAHLQKVPSNAAELTVNILAALGDGMVHHTRREKLNYIDKIFYLGSQKSVDEFVTPFATVRIESRRHVP